MILGPDFFESMGRRSCQKLRLHNMCVFTMGVSCLKINVRNCGDVVNAVMQIIHKKSIVFTNSVDPDETPQKAASHQGLCYLLCKAHLRTSSIGANP